MLDPRVMDPDQELIQYDAFEGAELDQIVDVLEAMRHWRTVERRLNDASRKYMKLGENDMRALRFMIASQRHGVLATPSDVAKHLQITTASVTKMLDRLAASDYIRRLPHPEDRRSTAIEVTEETQVIARQSVGESHAQRFHVVAEMTPAERETVSKFFAALSATGLPTSE
ncbi:MAG: MarR family transcriptional regulator [Micrococcaceae bacterium]|nr:MarR family transcriptional regulator [Micrococcaceae bacterium]